MEWWKKTLKVVGKALLQFFSKNWLKILASVVVVVVIGRVIAKIGKPERPMNFRPKSGADDVIQIENSKGIWIDIKVPDGHKAKDVRAAGLSEEQKWVMEVRHETVDRRNTSPINDSAADNFGL